MNAWKLEPGRDFEWCGGLLALLLITVAVALAQISSAQEFPELTGRVVDDAELLSPANRIRLVELLEQHETRTTNQVVVVTVAALHGQSIEDFGRALGNHWGIGQAAEDNGALLLVAPVERSVRIEVGSGLEGTLTDARAGDIIQNLILPSFRRRDFERGIVQGAEAIVAILEGRTSPAAPSAPAPVTQSPRPDRTPWPLLLLVLPAVVLLVMIAGDQQGKGGGSHFGGGMFFDGGASGGGDGFDAGGGGFDGGGESGDW